MSGMLIRNQNNSKKWRICLIVSSFTLSTLLEKCVVAPRPFTPFFLTYYPHARTLHYITQGLGVGMRVVLSRGCVNSCNVSAGHTLSSQHNTGPRAPCVAETERVEAGLAWKITVSLFWWDSYHCKLFHSLADVSVDVQGFVIRITATNHCYCVIFYFLFIYLFVA